VAYLESDTVLLTPNLRVSLRGYNRADVERALDGMRKRIVMMRADLERAQSAQKAADEIVTQARLTAAEMLADAAIEANRMLDDASNTSQELLDDTQRRCQQAARRGISAAFEMAGMLGYTDTRRERFDDGEEQEVFDDFFAGDETSTDREWMVAS